ncbi:MULTISPECIES: hypothetical protein [unclassified Oleiphilus]|jgi:N-acetylglutamate synthase-like GNAT family acetyltransferase|uniref:hypothetical protein n=3 Tax=Oleiphilus TaxID=141450 RepID=UPI0007C3C651|nr:MULTISPECIES: hypothetical protein [unclassified Oleiphilus]KZY44315.1 hypothetical protein A3732_12595 [Oleiphilus sp. HI0050]KZY79353.1 hypothetical protein A3741_20335 [Oleiphilus sp. HI0069]KZY84412.1 hypothetical protein A3740_04500 [Oleiphilus sp. HI0068]KZY87575.1 hypothetical protein A3743_01900 [Oleiphilus sp. HI0072]KZZ10688.1 hypothetical protein A3749_10600 [Oleiphilus sp. HI0078]KZZ18909.1 hypothetical protein A3752_16155 [Oleiphilus sp. HI0081]
MSQRYEIRPAEDGDSAALLRLIDQTPQEGEVHLNFERAPNFFHATKVTTTDPDVWVMIDHKTETLLASFSIGKREVYVDGEKRLTRYGNDLRIHQDYRGGRTLLRLFKKYRELMQDEWMQTVILDENKASINSVGSGRLSLPTYHQAGQFRTYMVDLYKKQHKATTLLVRRASNADKAQMQSFFDKHAPSKQFYPVYDFSKIGTKDNYYRGVDIENYFLAYDDDELIGMCAVWNQKDFKQTRFVSYQGKMKALRHINNIKSKFFGGLQLPSPGSLASYLSLHTVLCADNRIDIFQDLLSCILKTYHASDYEALIFGFDTRDPLHEVAKNLKAYQLLSNHYLASYGDDPSKEMKQQGLFYLEPTRL